MNRYCFRNADNKSVNGMSKHAAGLTLPYTF